jgi:HTH-type transcriptional repressor of puuD
MPELTIHRQPSLHYGQVAGRIRALRHAHAWSMPMLAAAAGLHRHTVGRIENGLRRPSYATLHALARAFGVPPQELLAGGPLAPDDWPDDSEEGIALTDRLCHGT